MPTRDRMIEIAALVHILDERVLLVRPKGKGAFYMPGGKLEPGEDGPTALRREVAEELGADISPATIQPYGTFEERAYGEPGSRVRIDCYRAALDAPPEASAEIAELRWFTAAEYLEMAETAPAAAMIVRDLRARHLIG